MLDTEYDIDDFDMDDFFAALADALEEAIAPPKVAKALEGYEVYAIKSGTQWFFPDSGSITENEFSVNWIIFTDANYSIASEDEERIALKWDDVTAVRYTKQAVAEDVAEVLPLVA